MARAVGAWLVRVVPIESMKRKTICYTGFVGGPRSMGKVGHYLIAHLLARPHYRVLFAPWETDYLTGDWDPAVAELVVKDPSAQSVDQCVSFCSVRDARLPRFARTRSPWFYYELNSVPAGIVEEINGNDHVYVTSSFVQRVFAEHGVEVPTSVLGHGVDPAHYDYVARSKRDPFVFLCIAEHTSRKNLPALIRCFERAFADETDVRLVLKLGLHGRSGLDQHISQEGKILVRAESIEREADLVELYGNAHCFVLPTRAEGFGMPILEAMATGLPVIVTRYGGQLDFCTDDNAYLIDSRGMVASDSHCFPYIESQWSDPDEDHLVHLMREVYDNYERAVEIGRRAWETASRDWTWEKQLSRAFP